MRSGVLDLSELAERKTLTGRETCQRHSSGKRSAAGAVRGARENAQDVRRASVETRAGRDADQQGHERTDTARGSIARADAERQAAATQAAGQVSSGGRIRRPLRRSTISVSPTGSASPGRYLSSTVAPASSSWALAFSASSLVRLLEHRLRGAVDEVLGLLQAEARERAHLLDDLDLLVAGGDEHDVELVLLLGRGRRAAATRGRAAAATATGAAAVTPNSSSNAFRNSFSSSTVMFLKTSSRSAVLMVAISALLFSTDWSRHFGLGPRHGRLGRRRALGGVPRRRRMPSVSDREPRSGVGRLVGGSPPTAPARFGRRPAPREPRRSSMRWSIRP